MMRSIALAVALASMSGLVLAQANLENPQGGATESGIGIISGWHCSAESIEVIIDGVSRGNAFVGSRRADTASVCGSTENGFSMLINFNNLPPGSHSIRVLGDGIEFAQREFTTVRSGGVAYLSGAQRQVDVPDFPSPGVTTHLAWSQAKQSFVVIGSSQGPGGGNGVDELDGYYSGMLDVSLSGAQCHSHYLFQGTTPAEYSVTTSGDSASIVGYIQTDACTFTLTRTGSDGSGGHNFSGTSSCLIGPDSSNVTVTGLRKVNNKILGTLAIGFQGCTQTLNLR